MKRLIIALAGTALLAACASQAGDPAEPKPAPEAPPATASAPAPPSLPCDVKGILEKNCTSCHGEPPRFGAPMPLVTHAQVAANASTVLRRITDDARPMPPPPNARLSDGDRKAFEAWVRAGTPAGAGSGCETASKPGAPVAKPLSCAVDQRVRPPKPIAIDKSVPDPYYCYGFDVTSDVKRHVIGIGPHVDNDRVLHHILLFQSAEPFSREPVRCNKTPSSDWKLVAGWAPGVGNIELPKEAGFVEEAGDTHWIVQVHYNNAAGNTDALTDDSGMDLCSTDQLREFDADVMASGSTSFTIPPRSTYDLTCLYQWGSGFVGRGLPDTPDVHVFNVQGHMHGLGTKMEVHKIPYGRSKRDKIYVNDAFDFNSQEVRDVDIDITQDDIIQTRCVWKNTGDAPVKWGEGTHEEMCFAFLGYYPRIIDPKANLWKWVSPAASTQNHCYDNR